ncbi:hypothetical protein D0Z07_7583 [Hyphodiscus hymeniophilus]|uniref:NAD-dependent epimerase/dehydratase domain-containing protein n=1 Tax=Hyphodiscus hymeniophilus TaxID=353542 RepID=A0A9P6VET6_9HELO|nr:hypothetical protein D0Z07_7583 [Hyphodiscus hymeniophilus]
MPNILVLGATGYIGSALCSALTRSGSHTVYGIARTPLSARTLSRAEVVPIVGSFSEKTGFLALINSTTPIDIVLNCAEAPSEVQTLLDDIKVLGQQRLDSARKAGVRTPKLGYIYVSGSWVHGSSDEPTNDLAPVAVPYARDQSAKLVAWRAVHEQAVLAASDVLGVMIVRPALVYGRAGNIWTGLFAPILAARNAGEKVVEITADLKSRPGLVHVDDVASGLRAAVEQLPSVWHLI